VYDCPRKGESHSSLPDTGILVMSDVLNVQAWEEKHVTVPLGPDGFAGFSVVGGRGPNFLTLRHSSLPR